MGKRTAKRQEEKAKMKKYVRRECISTLVYLIFVAVAVFVILTYVGQRTVVFGDSMCNTLHEGENLILDKWSYHFRDPERFEIIVFPGPEKDGESRYYIKRVIGLPGETVQIKDDGKVYINDDLLEEDVYGITDTIDDPGDFSEAYTLKEDEYFCLGDNRPVSYDSRFTEVGPVTRSEIIGRAWVRILPISKFGKLE